MADFGCEVPVREHMVRLRTPSSGLIITAGESAIIDASEGRDSMQKYSEDDLEEML